MTKDFVLRDIDPLDPEEIELVAKRMKLTLMEVVGQSKGAKMYSKDWLIQRVRFHINSDSCQGRVVIVEDSTVEIVGHTILRIEPGFGLFSTFYVDPPFRREGIGGMLVDFGEKWFRDCGISKARTYTAETNEPLLQLMCRHGYVVALRKDDMVSLEKELQF